MLSHVWVEKVKLLFFHQAYIKAFIDFVFRQPLPNDTNAIFLNIFFSIY
jgi:hypothetical protein